VGEITGSCVLRSYCDVDVEAAEQMEIYVLADDVESMLRVSERGRADGRHRGT